MKDIKPRCFVDMDGVLCDFFGAFKDVRRKDPNFKFPQSRIGFFKNLEPMPDAIESFNKLKEHYDVWILTRPSFKNINCFNEKAEWVLEPEFEGEWIEFASEEFPDWISVIDYLINNNLSQ